jgi:hypothetical protein
MVAGVPRHARSTISKGSVADTSKRRRSKGVMCNPGTQLPASCLPERRYIVLPQVFASSDSSVCSGISELSDPIEKQAGFSSILESFSYLCLGGEVDVGGSKSNHRHKEHRRRSTGSAPGPQTTRVVYPIASYPAPLNSRKLIEKRRQSLPQNFFRPVPSHI